MTDLRTCSLLEILTRPLGKPATFISASIPPVLQSDAGAAWVAQVLCWVALHGISQENRPLLDAFTFSTGIWVPSQQYALDYLRELQHHQVAEDLLQRYADFWT